MIRKLAPYIVAGSLVIPGYGLDNLVSIAPPSGYGVLAIGYDTNKDGEADLVELRRYDPGSFSVSKPFHIWYDQNGDGRMSIEECMDLEDSLRGGR